MSDLVAGILRPSSVFSTAWFQALAVFVALNTLIYVGLTLAKLTRWPRQVKPRRATGERAGAAPSGRA